MEVRADKGDELKPGDKVLCDTFKPSRTTSTSIGTSKGKGFMGVVARHHFRGGAATHGSMFHRAPGLDRALGVPVARLSRARAPRAGWAAGRPRRRTSSSCAWTREKNLLYI